MYSMLEKFFARKSAALPASCPLFGIMDLKLPKLGEGSDSGVVVSILVNEGDTIAKDQTIIELENEKAVAGMAATAFSFSSSMMV